MLGPAESSMASDAFNAVAGTATDLSAGMIGQAFGFGLNAASASKAWDRQKNMLTRGPTYMMQGLAKAGINPILAATQLRMPSASMAPQAGNPSNPAKGSRLDALQAALLREQTNTQLMMQANNAAQANKLGVETDRLLSEKPKWKKLYDFWASDEGTDITRMGAVTGALPNDIGAMAAKGLYDMYRSGKLKELMPSLFP